MSSLGTVTVEIEIEPVVKLVCYQQRCRFNRIHSRDASWYCDLKHVELNAAGCCALQESRPDSVAATSPTTPNTEARAPSQPPLIRRGSRPGWNIHSDIAFNMGGDTGQYGAGGTDG